MKQNQVRNKERMNTKKTSNNYQQARQLHCSKPLLQMLHNNRHYHLQYDARRRNLQGVS